MQTGYQALMALTFDEIQVLDYEGIMQCKGWIKLLSAKQMQEQLCQRRIVIVEQRHKNLKDLQLKGQSVVVTKIRQNKSTWSDRLLSSCYSLFSPSVLQSQVMKMQPQAIHMPYNNDRKLQLRENTLKPSQTKRAGQSTDQAKNQSERKRFLTQSYSTEIKKNPLEFKLIQDLEEQSLTLLEVQSDTAQEIEVNKPQIQLKIQATKSSISDKFQVKKVKSE